MSTLSRMSIVFKIQDFSLPRCLAGACLTSGLGAVLTAEGMGWLAVGRTLLGVGAGALLVAVPLYTVEMSPPRLW